MREQRVKVGEIELQIRDYERGGEAIVFLHFGGGNLMMWQQVVPYFQADYRLVLLDLRGHGKSDKPRIGNHIDQMAGDVAGVMDHLAIERAHVVGSSMGAEVGLSLAAIDPQRVTALVCDGALYSEYGPYGIWDGSQADFEHYVEQQLAKLRDRPERVYPSVEALVAARREALEKNGWWNRYVETFTEYDACEVSPGQYALSCPKWAKEEYLSHYYAYRFEEYYRRVKCPVLLLPDAEASQDERMKQAMQGLCKLAAKGKIVAVPDWEHPYGWMLEPDQMCQAVREFLAQVRN
jgi:pimeloyl-ACP methyl ester carboxylesterase